MKKYIRFTYAAIKRYGSKNWHAEKYGGAIEFSTSYVVSVSECGIAELTVNSIYRDYPFIVELSNGTKFLCYLHEYGRAAGDEILSTEGEEANGQVNTVCYETAYKYANKLYF